jgi:hypothetical protein
MMRALADLCATNPDEAIVEAGTTIGAVEQLVTLLAGQRPLP